MTIHITKDYGLVMEKKEARTKSEFSIVIPTYNRPDDLKDLFFSILDQTESPKEVVIVDESDNPKTRDLVTLLSTHFSERGIALKYLHNPKRTSAGAARNLGVLHATGDIIVFLDDDVILERNYIKAISETYRDYPNAVGVQGFIVNTPKLENPSLLLRNQLRKMFFLYHFGKDKCTVLPSGANTYPNRISRIIECQWLQGCNQSFKSRFLKEIKFDENLKKYSFLEDVDLSYRLFKKYPHSLYMTPRARVFHKWSKAERLSVASLLRTQTINRTYFFYKNIEQTFLNEFIFVWSSVGQVVFSSLVLTKHILSFRKSTGSEARYIVVTLTSYVYALRHMKDIKKGDLRFHEKTF